LTIALTATTALLARLTADFTGRRAMLEIRSTRDSLLIRLTRAPGLRSSTAAPRRRA